MLWTRKQNPPPDRSRAVGIDVTASRVRAAAAGNGRVRAIALDDTAEELLLYIACDRRTPEVGRAGYSLCRVLPHAVCSNFLPALAQSREFRAGRHTLTAESALDLVFHKLHAPIAAESDAVALALPAYLAPGQVTKVVASATRARLTLKGTAAAPLAVAAARAAAVLSGRPATPPAEGVVPMRPIPSGPGGVVVIDADEFALSATVVEVQRDMAKLLASAAWPRLGVKAWKDRLLDAIADRCVRLCRRDPRDSAEAEQALFMQLDDALDRVRAGQRIHLTVRTAHWYQDVIQQPDEFDGYCTGLTHAAAESIRELVSGTALALPPRSVWLTHAAGRLPGLAKAIHQDTPEGTMVDVLPAGAVEHAAADLVPRWLMGDLPRTHLDSAIELPAVSSQPSASQPKTGGRR